MFDGRETHAPLNNGQTFAANLVADLTQQAIDAITTHSALLSGNQSDRGAETRLGCLPQFTLKISELDDGQVTVG